MESIQTWDIQLKALHSQLLKELAVVDSQEEEPILAARNSIDICVRAMKQLKDFILLNEFPSVEQEIDFFKRIKPSFQCHLIFYTDLFQMLLKKPFSKVNEAQYFQNELKQIKYFFKNNLDFIKYYRSGAVNLDFQFFTRAGALSAIQFHPRFLDVDTKFSSLNDYLVARVWASEKIAGYFESQMTGLKPDSNSLPGNPLLWTDPKMALYELGYIIKSKGSCNNGKATVGEIIEVLGIAFNIKLDRNHTRSFQQILFRQEGPTAYIDAAVKDYLSYIDRLNDK